jgi:hypothetical protein
MNVPAPLTRSAERISKSEIFASPNIGDFESCLVRGFLSINEKKQADFSRYDAFKGRVISRLHEFERCTATHENCPAKHLVPAAFLSLRRDDLRSRFPGAVQSLQQRRSCLPNFGKADGNPELLIRAARGLTFGLPGEGHVIPDRRALRGLPPTARFQIFRARNTFKARGSMFGSGRGFGERVP